jgi:hypothetical protein
MPRGNERPALDRYAGRARLWLRHKILKMSQTELARELGVTFQQEQK